MPVLVRAKQESDTDLQQVLSKDHSQTVAIQEAGPYVDPDTSTSAGSSLSPRLARRSWTCFRRTLSNGGFSWSSSVPARKSKAETLRWSRERDGVSQARGGMKIKNAGIRKRVRSDVQSFFQVCIAESIRSFGKGVEDGIREADVKIDVGSELVLPEAGVRTPFRRGRIREVATGRMNRKTRRD
jgi:hypothetical protein